MRILLDTNVIISALLFGGKPRIILSSVIRKEHTAITSTILLSELTDVLHKKFGYSQSAATAVDVQVRRLCVIVSPDETIDVVADISDNRVLEAAVEGKCEVIITGDTDLLTIKRYRTIRIVTPDEFLHETTN